MDRRMENNRPLQTPDEPGEFLDEDIPRKQWATLLADLQMQWEVERSKTVLRMIAATPDKLWTISSSPVHDTVYPTGNCACEY